MYNLLFKNLTLKISIVLIFLLSINISCKSNKKSDEIYVASWNLENLFDTVDDPNKFDEEFTPNGSGNWTKERLEKKLDNLVTSATISVIGFLHYERRD